MANRGSSSSADMRALFSRTITSRLPADLRAAVLVVLRVPVEGPDILSAMVEASRSLPVKKRPKMAELLRRGRYTSRRTATDVHEMQLLQERQQILLNELHRVRNTLAIVCLIAERSADTNDTAEDYARHLEGRINALARTQAVLMSMPDASMELKDLIESEISPQTGKNTNPV
jgi:two-component sensor histidine kinase